MSGLQFDENLAIREVLDDVVAMVDRREKLIQSATEVAERSRNDLTTRNVKRLEKYMTDFLVLFGPILVKVRNYQESLNESITETENYLRSLEGIIDAGKGVDGSSATIQELEKDANGVVEELQLMHQAHDKIDDLFNKTSRYNLSAKIEPKREEHTQPAKVPVGTKPRPIHTDFLARSRLPPGQPVKSEY